MKLPIRKKNLKWGLCKLYRGFICYFRSSIMYVNMTKFVKLSRTRLSKTLAWNLPRHWKQLLKRLQYESAIVIRARNMVQQFTHCEAILPVMGLNSPPNDYWIGWLILDYLAGPLLATWSLLVPNVTDRHPQLRTSITQQFTKSPHM